MQNHNRKAKMAKDEEARQKMEELKLEEERQKAEAEEGCASGS